MFADEIIYRYSLDACLPSQQAQKKTQYKEPLTASFLIDTILVITLQNKKITRLRKDH